MLVRTRTGFSLSLRSVCGGYVTSSRGYLTSPGYPQPYPASTECLWVVTMSPATLIQFQFTDLDIAGDNECGGDHMVLRNGARSSSPLFLINPSQGDSGQNGHLCGNQMPGNNDLLRIQQSLSYYYWGHKALSYLDNIGIVDSRCYQHKLKQPTCHVQIR